MSTLELFMVKRDQFESEWNECIKANDNCLSLLNPDSDEEKKKVEDLNDALDAVREKKEMLEFYKSEIRRRPAELLERKSDVAHENVEAMSPILESAENVSSIFGSAENVAESVTEK